MESQDKHQSSVSVAKFQKAEFTILWTIRLLSYDHRNFIPQK